MKLEEMILRNDRNNRYTETDIENHLREGVFVYTSYDEFFQEWVAGLNDEDGAPDAWERLDKAIINGTEYRYDIAL